LSSGCRPALCRGYRPLPLRSLCSHRHTRVNVCSLHVVFGTFRTTCRVRTWDSRIWHRSRTWILRLEVHPSPFLIVPILTDFLFFLFFWGSPRIFYKFGDSNLSTYQLIHGDSTTYIWTLITRPRLWNWNFNVRSWNIWQLGDYRSFLRW
jgi:hypothetical protein